MPDDPTTDPNESEGMRELRAALARAEGRAEAAEAVASSNAQAARDLAFLQAGVNTTSGMGAYFAQHYSGELTVEAIKAAATEVDPKLIVATDEQTPPIPVVLPGQTAEEAARAALGAEIVPPGTGPTVDTAEEMFKRYHERLAAGESRDVAQNELMHTILSGAMNGDSRFIFNPADHAEKAAAYAAANPI